MIDSIKQTISEIIAGILEINTGEIDETTHFGDYGFESVSMTELAAHVNERFSVEITPSLLYEYNTTGSLALHLLELVNKNQPVANPDAEIVCTVSHPEKSVSVEFLERQLIQIISGILEIAEEEIYPDEHFGELGFESISLEELAEKISVCFHLKMNPSLFYEKNTIRELALYLSLQPGGIFQNISMGKERLPEKTKIPYSIKKAPLEKASIPHNIRTDEIRMDDIAIIGLAGVFPRSGNLDEFWSYLVKGECVITPVPGERAELRKWRDKRKALDPAAPEPHGGFIQEADKFDPLFFKISPKEAELMDPQQRIYLQVVWNALEEAGYSVSSLAGSNTGVFTGISSHDYTDILRETKEPVNAFTSTGLAYSIIANRVSYLFDFHGPSQAIDTACSSSLVALHYAGESLRRGECDLAIAGGVNIILHPAYYESFYDAGMLSPAGKCKPFDKSADGYVRGEGAAALVLKPLDKAIEDHDHIHGLIKASSINHGGHTHSLTSPNVNAQAELIYKAYRSAGIHPGTIGYIEAHGTGTKLGDPIEIQGLKKAFELLYEKEEKSSSKQTYHALKNYCAIGSIKANIGHLEAAAGIAGVIKVLLSMKHGIIPGLANFKELNPYIDIGDSPFFISKESRVWEQRTGENGEKLPRRAGVSAFGFGGANAHVVLEESLVHDHTTPSAEHRAGIRRIVVFSAKNRERLRAYCRKMLEFLNTTLPGEKNEKSSRKEKISFEDFVFTLQAGRESLEERIAFITSSLEELRQALELYVKEGAPSCPCFEGNKDDSKGKFKSFFMGTEGQTYSTYLIENGKLESIAELWTGGIDIPWHSFYKGMLPQRISLPGYPFAGERYWITGTTPGMQAGNKLPANHHFPLSRAGDSDTQASTVTFTGREFFLDHHRIHGKPVLPGIVYLEIVRAAFIQNGHDPCITFRNVIWFKPFIMEHGPVKVLCSFSPGENEENTFRITAVHGQYPGIMPEVYAEGFVLCGTGQDAPPVLDIKTIKMECMEKKLPGAQCYEIIHTMGLEIGPGLRSIREIGIGRGKVLARLILPSIHSDESIELPEGFQTDYCIHPGIVDGALQAQLGFFPDSENRGKLFLPYCLDELTVFRKPEKEMWAYLTYNEDTTNNENKRKFDIDVCNDLGEVCMRFKGILFAREKKAEQTGNMLLRPVFKPGSMAEAINPNRHQRHYIIICETGKPVSEILKNRLKENDEHIEVIFYTDKGNTIAGRYREYGASLFLLIQDIFMQKPGTDVFIQVIVPLDGEKGLFAGFSGILKTAKIENPDFKGQVIEMTPDGEDPLEFAHFLSGVILAEAHHPDEERIRYRGRQRFTLSFEELDTLVIDDGIPGEVSPGEVSPGEVSPREGIPWVQFPWKKDGVYLITGGSGKLGLMFAQEIISRVPASIVIITGLSPGNPVFDETLPLLKEHRDTVLYRQLDVTDRKQVKEVLESYDRIDGILHCAGIIHDEYINRKTTEEFQAVLAPKVTGLVHLDELSARFKLDFIVLFSSVASILGNGGQADYACANAFMDAFAEYRNTLAAAGKRRGRTISIHWPYWNNGKMQIQEESLKMLYTLYGITPMEAKQGIQRFYDVFSYPYHEYLILNGSINKLRETLFSGNGSPVKETEPLSLPLSDDSQETGNGDEDSFFYFNAVKNILAALSSEILKLNTGTIKADKELSTFGFNSITLTKLVNEINRKFRLKLMPSLFFDYPTINSLSEYLLKKYKPEIKSLFTSPGKENKSGDTEKQTGIHRKEPGHRYIQQGASHPRKNEYVRPEASGKIAITGMSGCFPMAADLDEFWENLYSGKNCITKIPEQRWKWWHEYRDIRREIEKASINWGGFIEGVDEFDPLFFGISPREAELMDPQQRFIMMYIWKCIEDAGYSPESLYGTKTGLFIGTTQSGYSHLCLKAGTPIEGYTAQGYIPSIGPNRMSYLLNLRGPSEPVETACASSLVALHKAVTMMENKECEMAIAGGVNLIITPDFYMSFGKAGMLSKDGLCKTFSDRANGYVRGEGAGMFFLKPLAAAERDNDHIYGVILGSAENHGGRTHSLTAPNSKAQAEVIKEACRKAGVGPETITYIEAHGTGTRLGDPVEIEGLKISFHDMFEENSVHTMYSRYCGLGSVKTNIGHLEIAAGAAGIIKVLLQFKHKTLVKTLYCETINPYIQLDDSPFYILQENRKWDTSGEGGKNAIPRRAGVSSFGFGGVNSHVVLEEYIPENPGHQVYPNSPEPGLSVRTDDRAHVILLSAKNAKQLKEQVINLRQFLEKGLILEYQLPDLAYTLQTGRDAMEERLGMIVHSLDNLKEKLDGFSGEKKDILDLYHGRVKGNDETIQLFRSDKELKEVVGTWVRNKKYHRLIELWIKGLMIDWSLLYKEKRPSRISLPTYPFTREQYWVTRQEKENEAPYALSVCSYSLMQFEENWVEKAFSRENAEITASSPEAVLCFLSYEEDRKALTTAITGLLPDTEIIFLARDGGCRSVSGKIHESSGCNKLETAEDYDAFFKKIKQHFTRVDALLYLWAYENQGTIDERDYLPIVFILQAMKSAQFAFKNILLSGVYKDGLSRCYLESWIGFERSLRLHLPGVRCTVVLKENEERITAQWYSVLLKELFLAPERSVLYENGKRYVCCIHPAKDEKELPVDSGQDDTKCVPGGAGVNREKRLFTSIRPEGTYLITGGCGGIGLIFARYLCEEYKVNLVLTGRSGPGPGKQEIIDSLEKNGSRVLYFRADAGDPEKMKEVIHKSREQFGRIDGVIHAAGVLDKTEIFKKEIQSFYNTLIPKTKGLILLDELFKEDEPDFICCFSSISAVVGDLGSCDYAIGNRFMAAYALARAGGRTRGKSGCKILSICWPYWKEGGISFGEKEAIDVYLKTTGLGLLESRDGVHLFLDFLSGKKANHIVVYGDPVRMDRFFQMPSSDPSCSDSAVPCSINKGTASGIMGSSPKPEKVICTEETIEFDVTNQIGKLLKINPEQLDREAPLSDFGFDSINLSQFAALLSERYRLDIAPTLFYNCSTIEKLSAFLNKNHREILEAFFARLFQMENEDTPMHRNNHTLRAQAGIEYKEIKIIEEKTITEKKQITDEPIAIIGMSGRFPGARDISELWHILLNGKCVIEELPEGRFLWKHYTPAGEQESPGGETTGIIPKWCGIIPGIDEFDHLFFEISRHEAELMDPGQRLLLQEAWNALEDAGYGSSRVKSSRMGMFAGVEQGDDDRFPGRNVSLTSHHTGVLAARLAYFLNFSGPVIAVNTACSSGLAALHQGCLSLRAGECDTAIIAGVSTILSPQPLIAMNQAGMLSHDGRCCAFDSQAHGMVPGEAVVALVLKPLSCALKDRDPIYCIIKGSGMNYDGRTNGITAPNGVAQADLLKTVYEKYGIDPGGIDYVIAHGTGTKLGDPIEVNALIDAFRHYTAKQAYCAITSVKPNLGHTLAASGLVSLVSLILAMHYETIPPCINVEKENEYIRWNESPFYVNRKIKPWAKDRKGGAVNAFGMSGTNVHVVVESFTPQAREQTKHQPCYYLFCFSAKTPEALLGRIRLMISYLESGTAGKASPGDISYTLLTGRHHFEHRLAFTACSSEEALAVLKQVVNLNSFDPVFYGIVPLNYKIQKTAEQHIENVVSQLRSLTGHNGACKELLSTLAGYYCQGCDIPWFYPVPETYAQRIHLPGYPFEKQDCRGSILPVDKLPGVPSGSITSGIVPSCIVPAGTFSAGSMDDKHEPDDTFEGKVKSIVCDIIGLDRENMNIDKPLYQYGIDSILFVQIMQKMKNSMNVTISLERIQECQTTMEIISLAKEACGDTFVMKKNHEQGEAPCFEKTKKIVFPELIHLNNSTTGRPVFWFHAGIGGVEIYQKLAKNVDRPFYGIQAKGWMTSAEPLDGIMEMSAYYTKIILAVQPDGPYDLGGYSLGGFFVYETARQLQLAGRKVNSIVMLDTVYIEGAGDAPEDEDEVFKDAVFRVINMLLLSQHKKESDDLRAIMIHRDTLSGFKDKKAFLAETIRLAKKYGLYKTEMQLEYLIEQNAKVQSRYNGNKYKVIPLPQPGDVTCYYFRNKSGVFYGDLEPFFTLTPYDGGMDHIRYWQEWEKQIRNFHIIDLDSSGHVSLLAELRSSGKVISFCKEFYSGINEKRSMEVHGIRKISILAFGSRGDVQPLVALAKGLEKSGYEVTIAAIDEYKHLIKNSGIGYASLNLNAAAIEPLFSDGSGRENHVPFALSKKNKKVLEENISKWMDWAYEACKGCDVLIYTGLAYHHGLHIAGRLKVPALPVYFYPLLENSEIPSFLMPWWKAGPLYNRLSYRAEETLVWEATGKAINSWRTRYGLKPLTGKEIYRKKHRSTDPVIYGFSPLLFKKSQKWGENVYLTGYFILERDTLWQPSAGLKQFLESGPAPVYVNFGSMNDYLTRERGAMILDVLKKTKERFLLSTGLEAIKEEQLSPGMYITGYTPHHWLMPQVKAVIHHGGSGTVASVLYAGVPSVVIPFIVDQAFWGNLAYRMGVSPRPIPFRRLTAKKLEHSLHQVLYNRRIIEKAKELSLKIKAENGVDNAVSRIKEIFRE